MSIVKCKNCGLVYVNPRPKLEELLKVYDENYFSNDAYRKNEEENYFGYNEYIEDETNIVKKFYKKIERIENYLKRKGKLLDIGCACGFFMKLAQTRGWEVEGIEVSGFAAEYARRRFGFKVHTKILEEIKYPAEHFDAITMWDVIEHLPDPRRTLREVNRILKRGGILGIITPDIGSFVAKFLGKNWLELKRVKEHIYFFSKETITQMLCKEGFKVLGINTVGKHIKLKTVIKELNFMHLPGINLFSRWIERNGLGEKSIYIDPLYKIVIYAVKHRYSTFFK
jgi:2-polyprenyl-3-methyl-5-hydroxy-6-metoxy-1,4-benzoquinol methylase